MRENEDSKVSSGYEHSDIDSNPLKSLKTLRETFKLVDKIEEVLFGYRKVSIVVIVNSLTLNLKKEQRIHDNSNLIVGPKGLGKTTLLYHILARSNPKWIIPLPDRIFETDICNFPSEHFKRKVWVLDDLITSFRGTSLKQREQLMSFHNSFMSKGVYERRNSNTILRGRVVFQYGLAKENYSKYSKDMLLSTFSERLIMITYDFTPEEEDYILKKEDSKRKLPSVKLPFRKKEVEIEIPQELIEDTINATKRLRTMSELSPIRAKHYIQNFLKSNAYINNRKEVCDDDLKLFKWIESLHYTTKPDTLETEIICLIQETNDKDRIIGRKIKNRFKNRYSETRISTI